MLKELKEDLNFQIWIVFFISSNTDKFKWESRISSKKNFGISWKSIAEVNTKYVCIMKNKGGKIYN